MKLPIEVSKEIHANRETSLGYEAIVRDCINEAFEQASDFARDVKDKEGAIKHTGAFAVAERLKRRYGLTKEKKS